MDREFSSTFLSSSIILAIENLSVLFSRLFVVVFKVGDAIEYTGDDVTLVGDIIMTFPPSSESDMLLAVSIVGLRDIVG